MTDAIDEILRILGMWVLDPQDHTPRLAETREDVVVAMSQRILQHSRFNMVFDDPKEVVEVLVSTVFLSINHNFGEGDPILFETMVFGGPLDGEQQRYKTWDEAMVGHKDMINRVQRRGQVWVQ